MTLISLPGQCPHCGHDNTHPIPLPALAPPAAEPVGDAIEVRIGSYGAAYDGPDTCRAYTYKHQPGNMVAYRLGGVTQRAKHAIGGDNIDFGLSLLKLLEDAGFGVFDLARDGQNIAPQPQAPSQQLTSEYGLLETLMIEAGNVAHERGGTEEGEYLLTHDDLQAVITAVLRLVPVSADAQQVTATVPEGWKVVDEGERVIVQHADGTFYAARDDFGTDYISENILARFARAVLAQCVLSTESMSSEGGGNV